MLRSKDLLGAFDLRWKGFIGFRSHENKLPGLFDTISEEKYRSGLYKRNNKVTLLKFGVLPVDRHR
jgi:hypothetical protein